MLELYRAALRMRRASPAWATGRALAGPRPTGVLAFDARTPRFACVVNLSAGPVSLPGGAEVLLASGPLDGGRLPADTAVWLRIRRGPAVSG